MAEEIVFKNKENKHIFELLSKLVALKTTLKNANSYEKAKAHKEYTEYFNFLIKKFSYIPELHTRRYMKYSNYQDLLQEGMLGLVMALEKFNMERSRNFFQLANWYVKTRVRRSANKFDVIPVPIAMGKENALLRTEESPSIVDSHYTQGERLEHLQQSEIMKRTIAVLSDESQKAFCWYHGFKIVDGEVLVIDKKTIADIAEEMNLSRPKVKKIIETANRKLVAALS